MSGLRPFLAELKRRRVWRVAVVYAATAFVVVQVADLFFPRLALPEWSVTLVVVLALLGFPIALVLAWAFETSHEGVRRTEPAPGDVALESGRRGVLFGAAAGIALLAGGGWWLVAGGGSAPTIERLAVLPLSNLMDDPEQEYFVQGMHDRLISELQQAGIAVIARTSVMRYGAAGTPVREIARELGVDALIEGSVFRAGDSVAIEARLVDGASEEYLWRESFGGSLRNVAFLHRDLTRAIAREIQMALTPAAKARLAGVRPVDPQAYEAYLKGQFHWYKLTAPDFEAAFRYFESALEKDPDYALAHAGISRVWIGRLQRGMVRPRDATPRAKAAALEALALDSTLAEAHYTLALVKTWLEWDWDGGERAFLRAMALDPNYPDVRAHYSHFLMIMRRPDEAMAEMERALGLDPHNALFQVLYGANLLFLRRYDEAIVQFRNTLQAAPDAPLAQGGIGMALHEKGAYEEALLEWKAALAARGDRELEEALARGYAEGGYSGAARRTAETLAERARTTYVPPESIAKLFMYAGMEDRALDWLERGFEARLPNMRYVGVLPVYAGLHDDPRFQDLLRRMNLPG